MKVRDLMSHPLRVVASGATIAEVAAIMADSDVGVLPVVEDNRLVGIVTDRDIVVRAVADHVRGRTHVSQVMSRKVASCGPDDEVDAVLETMGALRVRRLPVCSADGRLLGLFSLGDAARTEEYQEAAARALSLTCRPHGPHSQKRAARPARPEPVGFPGWYDPALG